MIGSQLPHDRRGFVHKKLLGVAKRVAAPALNIASSFVPGGSIVRGLASRFIAPPPGPSLPTRSFVAPAVPRPRESVDDTILRMFATSSWADIGRAVGMTAAAAKNRYNRKYRPTHLPPPSRTPSIPPTNPVREAVIQAKPQPPMKPAPLPRRRTPQVVPSGIALAPVLRSQPMPVHKRILSGLGLTGTGPGPCRPGQRKIGNQCVDFSAAIPGGAPLFTPVGDIGEAVMGRYGAAYVPGSMVVDRAICLAGDVVGDDGLCYPKSSLRNNQRAWPKGRRPLLTGGDMRAISVASRAADRLTRTAVRLQDMGLIKKPVAARPRKKK